MREREHLAREESPLRPTGRPWTGFLPGPQRVVERAVVARFAGEIECRCTQRLDPVLLAVVEREMATLRVQSGAQRLGARLAETGQGLLAQLLGDGIDAGVGYRFENERGVPHELGTLGRAPGVRRRNCGIHAAVKVAGDVGRLTERDQHPVSYTHL